MRFYLELKTVNLLTKRNKSMTESAIWMLYRGCSIHLHALHALPQTGMKYYTWKYYHKLQISWDCKLGILVLYYNKPFGAVQVCSHAAIGRFSNLCALSTQENQRHVYQFLWRARATGDHWTKPMVVNSFWHIGYLTDLSSPDLEEIWQLVYKKIHSLNDTSTHILDLANAVCLWIMRSEFILKR